MHPLSKIKLFKKNESIVMHICLEYILILTCTKTNFFNIYNLPFLRSPNKGKIRVKVGPYTIFANLLAPVPTELHFSIIYLQWYVASQGTNQTVSAIFFFSNILLNNLLLNIFVQNTFPNSNYCNKKWMTHC